MKSSSPSCSCFPVSKPSHVVDASDQLLYGRTDGYQRDQDLAGQRAKSEKEVRSFALDQYRSLLELQGRMLRQK
jgi:hypothetical protein